MATVATVYDVGELLRYEQQHICEPVLVERYNRANPPLSETVEDSQNWQLGKQ
jgi:hypothetical protein